MAGWDGWHKGPGAGAHGRHIRASAAHDWRHIGTSTGAQHRWCNVGPGPGKFGKSPAIRRANVSRIEMSGPDLMRTHRFNPPNGESYVIVPYMGTI